ncbi:nitrate- and nitrite sensing domain-containing protein [Streptomyces sp. ET3-23]|uniref:sensor histidine kinase n=1 Tax=Streptomyces sp. ET3-23 TaxID=2885643 RepID=UPI0022351266|nr:nitrate- and nitrite sensing domain-containing protein [Streptomyces sp. ET3-23]
MTLVLVLPAALCISLAVPRVTHSLDKAEQLTRTEATVRLVVSATTLAHALENERDIAALTPGKPGDAVREHRAATDRALIAFRSRAQDTHGDVRVTQRVADAESALHALTDVRDKAFTDAMDTVASQTAYSDLVLPLLSLGTEANHGGDTASTEGWALYALSVGKLSLSSERALLNAAIAHGRVTPDVAAALLVSQGFQDIALRQFRSAAVPQDAAAYQRIAQHLAETGTMARTAAAAAQRDTKGDSRGAAPALQAQEWHRTASQALEGLRTVESEVTGRMLDSIAAAKAQARKDAALDSAFVAVALGLSLLVAAVAAHSLVSRLRRLRRAALQAAEHQLPALVASISQQAPGQVDLSTEPVDLGTRDEVGDVSRAFDAVIHEAVRQAADQAMLRKSVSAMLASMGRRSQLLVYRQLEMISELERNEAHPAKLEGLFRVDHLATRIRRHCENLLVLADERPGRVHAVPAPLLDVVRAAAAEVEQFTRVRIGDLPDVHITGPAVHDVSHLLAELLENATQYSGPADPVQVTTGASPAGGTVVKIRDRGVGMPAAKAAELNARLSDPPLVDVATTRQMGLYVVSRLAERHGIDVVLSCKGVGCTVAVELPPALLVAGPPHRGAGVHRPERQPTDTQEIPVVPDTPMPAGHVRPGPVAPGPMPPEGAPAPRNAAADGQLPLPRGPVAAPGAEQPTGAGLPRRVPRATLGGTNTAQKKDARTEMPSRTGFSPGELRGRMAGFHSGVRRARDEGGAAGVPRTQRVPPRRHDGLPTHEEDMGA